MKWLKGCWWSRAFLCASLFALMVLLIIVVILDSHLEVAAPWRMTGLLKSPVSQSTQFLIQNQCEKASGPSEHMHANSLPRGIIRETTDLYFHTLGGDPVREARETRASQSLLAMPVGIKQKETVDKIIGKFPEGQFMIMLFHYDGVVDQWNTYSWSSRAIHVVALNQTKWYCPC